MVNSTSTSASGVYSVREVEQILGISDDTLRRWLRDERLRGFRLPGVNGAWRIEAEEVERIKRNGQVEA